MFAIVSLLGISAAFAPPAGHAKKPEPIGSLQGLISPDDYPPEALDRNEQGDVGVLIRVSPIGAITECIIEKSASPTLDARTCELIRQRAKLKPPRGPHGKAIASELRSHITWKIGWNMPEPSEPWASTVIMSYAPNGDPVSCRVELEGAKKPAPDAPPQKCSFGPLPAAMKELGVIATVAAGQRFALGPIEGPQLGKDEILSSRMVLSLQIDAAGKLTACRLTEASAPMADADVCKLVAGKSFVPRKGTDGKPAPFSANMEFTNILHLQSPVVASPVT